MHNIVHNIISPEYVKTAFANSDILIVSYDMTNNIERSMRGVIAINIIDCDTLYISLISNRSGPKYKFRTHKTCNTGRDMFIYLKKYAKTHNYKTIRLNSIAETICYYDKIGFTMECRNRNIYNKHMLQLSQIMKIAIKDGRIDSDYDVDVNKCLKYFNRYLDGYYTTKNYTELQSNGYPMTFRL